MKKIIVISHLPVKDNEYVYYQYGFNLLETDKEIFFYNPFDFFTMRKIINLKMNIKNYFLRQDNFIVIPSLGFLPFSRYGLIKKINYYLNLLIFRFYSLFIFYKRCVFWHTSVKTLTEFYIFFPSKNINLVCGRLGERSNIFDKDETYFSQCDRIVVSSKKIRKKLEMLIAPAKIFLALGGFEATFMKKSKHFLEKMLDSRKYQIVNYNYYHKWITPVWLAKLKRGKKTYFLKYSNVMNNEEIRKEIRVINYLKNYNFENILLPEIVETILSADNSTIGFITKDYGEPLRWSENDSDNNFLGGQHLSLKSIDLVSRALLELVKISEEQRLNQSIIDKFNFEHWYKLKFSKYRQSFSKKVQRRINLDKIDIWFRENLDKIKKIDCRTVINNGDFYPRNIIFLSKKKKIVILDWAEAEICPFEKMLAYFLNLMSLNKSYQVNLLKAVESQLTINKRLLTVFKMVSAIDQLYLWQVKYSHNYCEGLIKIMQNNLRQAFLNLQGIHNNF
jgi:hypothetical protein